MIKRLFSIVAMVTLMSSCTQAQNAEQTTSDAPAQETTATPQAQVKEINMEQFAQLVADYDAATWTLKSDIPVVVDFNATWCGPCRRLAPILDELAQEYAGRIVFYSIDVDKNKPLAIKMDARSIPMLLVCPTQGPPQKIVGLYPKEELVKAIEYIIGEGK